MSNIPRALEAAHQLIVAVQNLSLARDLARVMEIVRKAARHLTGADGATFVLREGQHSHYADEDAIAPLWKGKRFPLERCISGWVMLEGKSATIADIYADARIPAEAYRPTFVKSLAMVPIRQTAPLGAIGVYWATPHEPTPDELQLLQALADSTSVAMENVEAHRKLEQRVRDRTAELEVANRELEAFCYTVSHDLRAPVRHIGGFVALLAKRSHLDATGLDYVGKVQLSVQHLNAQIDGLLRLSRISATTLSRLRVDLSALAREIADSVAASEPGREVKFRIAPHLQAQGDPGLMRVMLRTLIENAWKFTSRTPTPEIEVGASADRPGEYFVRDNGVGFNASTASRLFQPFQRFHHPSEFAGEGIGLAAAQRIIQKHGGVLRAEAAPNEGARFFFTLPTLQQ